MSKPDDIPAYVWNLAYEASFTGKLPVVANVARTIMTAIEAEREACAQVLDSAADSQKEAWDEYIGSGGKGPATSFEGIFRGQAAAIRKRGEP